MRHINFDNFPSYDNFSSSFCLDSQTFFWDELYRELDSNTLIETNDSEVFSADPYNASEEKAIIAPTEALNKEEKSEEISITNPEMSVRFHLESGGMLTVEQARTCYDRITPILVLKTLFESGKPLSKNDLVLRIKVLFNVGGSALDYCAERIGRQLEVLHKKHYVEAQRRRYWTLTDSGIWYLGISNIQLAAELQIISNTSSIAKKNLDAKVGGQIIPPPEAVKRQVLQQESSRELSARQNEHKRKRASDSDITARSSKVARTNFYHAMHTFR